MPPVGDGRLSRPGLRDGSAEPDMPAPPDIRTTATRCHPYYVISPQPQEISEELPMPPPDEAPEDQAYPPVDVAIVMESTYPYLKGGVSAVVHDIVTSNQDLTFGILHIAWDSDQPKEDLYGIPKNVLWVRRQFLSMQEHIDDFRTLPPKEL